MIQIFTIYNVFKFPKQIGLFNYKLITLTNTFCLFSVGITQCFHQIATEALAGGQHGMNILTEEEMTRFRTNICDPRLSVYF